MSSGWAVPAAFEHGDLVLDEHAGSWLRLRSRCVEIRPGVWAAMVEADDETNLAEAHFDGEFLWRVATPCDPELTGGQA